MAKTKKSAVESVNVRKIELLKKFNELINNGTKSIVPDNVAREIWSIWQEYTGRISNYRNCSVCFYPKIKFLKRESIRLNIKPEQIEEPKQPEQTEQTDE